MLRRGHFEMGKLESFARDVVVGPDDGDKLIDYTAAALYLPAVQAVVSTTLVSIISVLACWVIPLGGWPSYQPR